MRLIPDSDKQVVTDHNLKVYALFHDGLEDGVCRVERHRWFNFWVWGTPLKKAAIFLIVVVGGGLLMKWAKKKGGI